MPLLILFMSLKLGCALDYAACANTTHTFVKNIDGTSKVIELITLYERKFECIPIDLHPFLKKWSWPQKVSSDFLRKFPGCMHHLVMKTDHQAGVFWNCTEHETVSSISWLHETIHFITQGDSFGRLMELIIINRTITYRRKRLLTVCLPGSRHFLQFVILAEGPVGLYLQA
jgi:hypothetical protein